MSARALSLFLGGAWLSLACGACSAEAPVVQTQIVAPPTSASAVAAPELDLSPVPAPKTLLVTLRAPSPKQTLESVDRLGKLGPGALQGALDLASKGVARYFDLAQPIDVVVALDPATASLDRPRFFFAFSLPVGPDHQALLERIEQEGDEVRESGPGLYRVRSRDLHCELWAPGTRPSRMVCAEGIAALRELGPYLARTLAAEPPGKGDLLLRLHPAPAQDKLLPMAATALGEAMKDLRGELERAGIQDSELLEAPAAFERELLAFLAEPGEAGAVLTLDPQRAELRLDLELGLRGAESFGAKLLTGARPAPAPEAFYRLPSDADTALFATAADPALLAPIRRVAHKGADAALRFTPLAESDKGAILGLLDALPALRGVVIYGGGHGKPAPAFAGKPEAFSPKDAVDAARARAAQVVGWSLVSAAGDGRDTVDFLSRTSDVYKRLRRVELDKRDRALAAGSKDDKEWLRARRRELDHWPTFGTVATPAGLPAGSTAYQLEVEIESRDVWHEMHPISDGTPPHPKTASTGRAQLLFLVVPDSDGRYWLGWGLDGALLQAKLATALSSGKRGDQLVSSSRDLSPFKAPLRAGGFVSPGVFLRDLARLDPRDHDFRDLAGGLDAVPNRGAGAFVLAVGGQVGERPSLKVSLQADRRTSEDLAAALARDLVR